MATDRSRRRPSNAETVERILERIRATRNFDFRHYKRPTLHRRIERRMAERKCKTAAEYLALLDRDPAECDALIASMLIKVTGFFRDAETWTLLSGKVIPQLLAEKRPGEEIRVWCAGSATGEEAFSIGILLAEAMGPAFQNQEVKIFGTDVDQKAIAFARHGVYSREQVKSVPAGILKTWFVEDPTGWSVRKEIRRTVVFGVNNLVSDAPISRLDLLLCRNVFIYLDGALQKRVLTRFHHALRRHGLLVLGKSELIPFAGKIFESVDQQRRIYRKDGRRDAAVAQERLVSLLEQESMALAVEEGRPDLNTVDQFHRDIVQSLRVPMVATAPDGAILRWNAAAAALWGLSEEEVTGKKLPALTLPGLPGELLVEKTAAVREGKSDVQRSRGVLHRGGDHPPLELSVEITPLRDTANEMSGLLYAVHDMTAFADLERDLRKSTEEREAALEELQSINEELQSANEELETTNEELQSANEELQTTNEELQSTNEELETTNEELQSTNAELDATNHELAHCTDELNKLAFYQRAIIRSLSAGIIVGDESARITLWNLAAERLLGVTEAEAVGQVLWTLHVPSLNRGSLAKVRKSVSQNVSVRNEEVPYELPGGLQGKAMLSAVPIMDTGRPLGAVIIIEDVTRLANLAAENARLKENGGRASKEA